jgi:hypothetical protein
MRLFQNSGVHSSYFNRLDELAAKTNSFQGRRQELLKDRFGALHFLKPALENDNDTFFTNGDDRTLQIAWAREQGMRESALDKILLAQVEHHRTEVFYNTDPTRYGSALVHKLPGCVKKTLCWRAAPSGSVDLSAYGAVVCNFRAILEDWRLKGCRVEYFYPAIDPVMDEYGHGDRPIDVLFVGGYSRHHSARAKVLEDIAALNPSSRVVYCFDVSRMTKVAESSLGRFIPQLRKLRRTEKIAEVTRPAVFGRALYELLGQAKIVLNGAIDMAGNDRGNMRCFEAMGCGALLLSDNGLYPDGMTDGQTIVTYKNSGEALALARRYLSDPQGMGAIATLGRQSVEKIYSKTAQWQRFCEIVSLI